MAPPRGWTTSASIGGIHARYNRYRRLQCAEILQVSIPIPEFGRASPGKSVFNAGSTREFTKEAGP